MNEQSRLRSHDDALYLAESYRAARGEEARLADYYRKTLTPMLEQLRAEGAVREHRLHRLRFKAEKHGEFEAWNFLLLIEVRDAAAGREVVERTRELPAFKGLALVRRELLAATPESNYPHPSARVESRGGRPFFAVEYVDVRQECLGEFRDIMIRRNGPAMRHIMEHARWCHSMIGLETVEVWERDETLPDWNQIHVVGLYPESFFKYKKDFAAGLAAGGSGVSFEENFGRLKQIRTMLYKTVGGRV